MFGCFGGSDQDAKQPAPPPITTPNSGLYDIDPDMDYGAGNANDTLHLDRPLSKYELLPIAKKKEYDRLQKKKAQNRKFINNADMRRRGADLEIINILQGGAKVQQGDNQSYRQVNSDPVAAIKHQRWIKETSQIEIEGLEKENADLDRQMDKILNESNQSCFPKDTLVMLNDGTQKPIQNVNIGDEVMVYDIGKDTISSSKVMKKFVSPNNHMYVINKSINATAYERFLTLDGWKKIREIEAGQDFIFDGNGYVEVESIHKENKNLTVYNLNIDTAHNFFVTPQDGSRIYLIHNSGGGGGGGK